MWRDWSSAECINISLSNVCPLCFTLCVYIITHGIKNLSTANFGRQIGIVGWGGIPNNQLTPTCINGGYIWNPWSTRQSLFEHICWLFSPTKWEVFPISQSTKWLDIRMRQSTFSPISMSGCTLWFILPGFFWLTHKNKANSPKLRENYFIRA